MPSNVIIGLGNTGTQIVKTAVRSAKLSDVKFYTIDSVTTSTDMDSVHNYKSIPIIVDDKSGSGRDRERGAAMFMYHDTNGSFNELYEDVKNAKSPIFIITSSAGGTGSGVAPILCKKLMDLSTEEKDITVVPIIVCPAIKDPAAFHMNTSDLMIELQDVGITTYSIFRNVFGEADYRDINEEIVRSIELILGKWYTDSGADTIDDSDLFNILRVPGRFISVVVESDDPHKLKRLITEKTLHSFQPAWNIDDTKVATVYTAYGVTSPFAYEDFKDMFVDIRERISSYVDEYRNICTRDGSCSASVIIAGLPHAELVDVDMEYTETKGIADGAKRSKRPSFMSKNKPISPVTRKTGYEAIDNFNWRKKND